MPVEGEMTTTAYKLGAIEKAIENIAENIESSNVSRSKIHEKLDTVRAELAVVQRDVKDIDERLQKVEATAAEISKWRERGIGAWLLIVGISGSIGAAAVTWGKKVWMLVSGG